ncbi:MAG: hypothetical protein LBM59_01095 [Ruminococcus sp.]|jgi:hypothetical protein|nr:hypothetical protein [Ruminococcus sp.]
MSIPIEKLVTDLGHSLGRANKFIETASVDMFFKAGYKIKSSAADDIISYTPIMYEVSFPETASQSGKNDSGSVSEQKLAIPVTALLNNTSMCIESAEITMKFTLEETAEGVAAVLHSDKVDNAYALSQMTVKFANTPSSEAVARITEQQFRGKI